MKSAKSAFFLLFLGCLVSQLSLSQVSIKGVVRSAKAKGIYGASISIKDSYDGATSDSSGRFSFTTLAMGEQTLLVTVVGFKPYEQKIKLEAPINLTIELKEEVTELEAVTLSAGTFEASDRKRASAVLDRYCDHGKC